MTDVREMGDEDLLAEFRFAPVERDFSDTKNTAFKYKTELLSRLAERRLLLKLAEAVPKFIEQPVVPAYFIEMQQAYSDWTEFKQREGRE